MTEYELGFYDARNSILELIDEWYSTYKTSLDAVTVPIAIGFLKRAIIDADVEEME